MSMNGTQASAFQAASGFPASSSYLFFVGVAVAIIFVWGAWAVGSCYRGGATGNLDRTIASTSLVRILLLCMILTAFVLS